MSDLIRLERIGSTPWGTLGTLLLADGSAFPTIERPWEYNAPGKSCIPAGEYTLALRASGVVERSSGNAFHQGWEVTGVPGRSLIMLHPANWAHELEGCIAPGRAHVIMQGKLAVSASRAAFTDMMTRMGKRDAWRLAVVWITPE